MSDGTFAIVLVPTRELASQVSSQLRKLLKYVQGAHVATLNSPSSISKAQSRAAIVGKRKQSGSSASVRVEEANSFVRTADVLVGTPASVVALRQDHGRSVLDKVSFVVVDEADLVLSFGHGADARSALSAIPPTAQAMLVSATLDAEGLPELRKVVLRHPMTVKVTAQSGMDPSTPDGTVPGPDVSHYFARLLSPVDRYLVTYAMLRLNVISGKVLIFTNGTNAAFRLKLFLDQFKVKSAVLNSELPANSRVHCVEQFNASIFDILIATDEMRRDDSSSRETKARKRSRSDASGASDGDVSEEDADVPDAGSEETLKKNQRKPNSAKKTAGDSEFGVARGVDFRGVAAVLNFDIPESYTSYVHRAGRTARAGASGTVLSLVVSDADQLGVVSMGKQAGIYVGPLAFQMDQIEAFRYRVEDSLRSVTNAAVRQARLAEVRREMINSDRLKDYFEDNPMDLDALKHDLSLARHVPEHLARVPGYLLPPALRDSVSVAPVRKSRVRRRSNASSALRGSKNYDPLKTFSTEKRTSGNSRQRYQCRHGVSKPGAKGGAGRTRKVGGRKNA
jgi:ATP-dependent RNA helicase DDX56/DBP9